MYAKRMLKNKGKGDLKEEYADTPEGRIVAHLIIAGSTYEEIALQTKKHRSAIYRMVRKKSFLKLLNGVERDMFRAVEKKFNKLYKDSIERLGELVLSENEKVALEAIEKVFRLHKKYDTGEHKGPAVGLVFNNPSLTLPESSSDKLMKILALPAAKEVEVRSAEGG
jgi:hypothetical protein